MQTNGASAPDDPVLHEFTPLLRRQLLHLWQAMLQLVQETAPRDPHDPLAPTRAEAYATTPIY